jgi:hypothetical protein
MGHPFSGALLHFHQISSYSGIFFQQIGALLHTHDGPLGPFMTHISEHVSARRQYEYMDEEHSDEYMYDRNIVTIGT